MPPKKKKGKKKGKGGKKKEVASSGPAAVRGPESLQAESLLQRQSLEQQIAVLKARCESLRQHNDDLKIKRSKGEKDTHEFVAYFQKELEKGPIRSISFLITSAWDGIGLFKILF